MKKLNSILNLLLGFALVFVFSGMIGSAAASIADDQTMFKPVFYGTAVTTLTGSLIYSPSAGALFASPIVNNLAAYAGKNYKALIGQLFNDLKDTGISVEENIKVATRFPKLSVGNGLKPYSPTFAPTDDLTYTDRALIPLMAKRELLIEPAKYEGTYMAESTNKNSKWYGVPEENYVWDQVIKALKNEIIVETMYYGDTASLVDARKVCDGFQKIINAIGLTAVATGAVTNLNAVSKFEQMYKTAIAQKPAWKNEMLTLYCSHNNFFNYIENYRSAFPQDPSLYSDGAKPMYLKISSGRCIIKPATWMGSSGRLILTPMENMKLGTDKLSDMNTINTVPAVWTLQAGIRFTLGFQIPDVECIWINDQA